MLNIRAFLRGLRILPVSSTSIDSKGEFEVIDASGKAQYHNGTSVSPVVTENHTATLTQKTIDAASNTISNISDTEVKTGAAINAAKIADGSVSNAEYQRLDGVTSNIQTQLDGKQPTGNYITDLTGDVAASGPGSVAATIQANVVSNSKAAQMPANTVKGNNTGSTTNASDLTTTQVNTLLGTITSLTGDVTASGPGASAATIANNAVTNAKAAQMAAHTFKGNNTGSTANASDLTKAQLTAELNTFTDTLQGLVPASGGGTANFLRADGIFATPAAALGSQIIVGSASDVSNGYANYSSLVSAITAASTGGYIQVLSTYSSTENISLAKQLCIVGSGRGSVITGTVTFASGSNFSRLTNIKITGTITMNSGLAGIEVDSVWTSTADAFLIDSTVTGEYIMAIQE